MLRVSEQFHDSDVGRQRQGNEDSLFARSPLFAVADGMGGAEAGEVASDIAVRCFESGVDDAAPAQSLVETVKTANQQINEQSRSDRRRAGMGTTLTAAYVSRDDEVVVAHVGDSRCYLLRDGDLVRLTHDHSLVGELVARGKLTEAQAESHPQRSVITRALGPEPEVQVDVDVFAAKPNDVFLLCSDGLTSMIPEGQIKQILLDRPALEQAGRELIAAANHAGGRDNITVILFRLEEVQSATPVPNDSEAGLTAVHGDAGQPTRETAVVEADTGEQPAVAATRVQNRESRRGDTVVLPAVSPHDGSPKSGAASVAGGRAVASGRVRSPNGDDQHASPREPAAPRRRRRPLRVLAVLLLFVFPLVAGAWLSSRLVYFVGASPTPAQQLTIYRGVPYELPGGVRLYERFYTSGVTAYMLPASRRRTLLDHQLRSREDVEDLVLQIERGELNQ
ncbi:MAG: Stp1/IreP family PP2C-type Ser/Thr phosphatase [Actinomycetota bacterium]|nr:Stp1/IreP family PP2C-type Ser/Thr phosphatase [Actinomycetota bacterium]